MNVLGRTGRIFAIACAAALVLAACTSGKVTRSTSSGPSAGPSTSSSTSSSPSTQPPATPTTTDPATRPGSGAPVDVSLYEGDNQTYGVAAPIIAYFSKKVTDASTFDQAVTVTVNGQPAGGAWYWESSSRTSQALEAHYRTPNYWPAHSAIKVNLPLTGLWAGAGLQFANSLTLSMNIGAAQVATVDGTPGVDTMTITSDGAPVKTLKVSLGAAKTPTYLGTAVVLEKDNPQRMVSSPGEAYYNILVPWSVRVTYDGEFIHDAYWNGHLGTENLSHGCTNLSPADAQWYYNWSQIGDPVTWVNTGTSQVIPADDGWGDWNVPWATYAAGGLLAA